MHRLSLIIILSLYTFGMFGQNPHGTNLKIDCTACHNSSGWEITSGNWENRAFDHDKTDFELQGQHTRVDCRSCHQTLVFNEATGECISCHTDIHQQTVGVNCTRCHSNENWLVDNITEIHQDNGFPLVGMHALISCFECHQSESNLAFHRIGNECIDCHSQDYASTTSPDHVAGGYSTNCIECHSINGFDWTSENVNHNFFPLTKGHEIEDCTQCHTGGNFANTPTDCFTCHSDDYNTAVNPNHMASGFSTECTDCHTTDVGWRPAEFTIHDNLYFPIYSGEHRGEWNDCLDCHSNPSNYSEFTCITCHTNPSTDNEHRGISGYSYNSPACLACHPTGSEHGAFDHSRTNFPLTGEHTMLECLDCHANGYEGTPTDCFACHEQDFNQSLNPNHNNLNLSIDCASCHTTDPDWYPATFANHNDYYALNGAHAAIAGNCAECHHGDYTNTPTTCVDCHMEEYNATNNPNHSQAMFPTDCESCHNETNWTPATFDHDGMYFPIYSEKHSEAWNQCVDCHTNAGNYAVFSCLDCHEHNNEGELFDKHKDFSGYSYTSNACFSCHPNGTK